MPWRKQLFWLPEYSVGDSVLDAQHKKLLRLCQAAARYLGKQLEDEPERYNDVLHDLTIFAQEHFSIEESILEHVCYPALEEHRSEHKIYLTKLSLFVRDAERGPIHPVELSEWLNNWWLGHVLGSDQKYSRFLLRGSDSLNVG